MRQFIVVGRASITDQLNQQTVEAEDAIDAVKRVTGFESLTVVPGCNAVSGVTIVRAADYPEQPVLLFVLDRNL